jgi:hypothetical protein
VVSLDVDFRAAFFSIDMLDEGKHPVACEKYQADSFRINV